MHVGDIDVMIDVYIYCLLQWNVKKFFAECLATALGKVFFKKNLEILCRVPKQGHSAKKLF